jgi:hypothetical protein
MVVSFADIAVGLIVDIIRLLRIESADKHRHLDRELKLLSQSLILTASAIQVYEHTSPGNSLANTVYPEVMRCHEVLKDIHDKSLHYWEGLNSTSIRDLWGLVWLSGWDWDELARSIKDLSSRREPLNRFLMALNSCVLPILHGYPTKICYTPKIISSIGWMDHGHEFHTGQLSIARFYHSLRQYMLPLRHIQINKILVVDHLGRNIPVPTLFCSTWKVDFILFLYR